MFAERVGSSATFEERIHLLEGCVGLQFVKRNDCAAGEVLRCNWQAVNLTHTEAEVGFSANDGTPSERVRRA